MFVRHLRRVADPTYKPLSQMINRNFASSYKEFLLDKVYINGKWSSGSGGKTFPVYDPSSGEILHQAADCGERDTLDAIEAASNAFSTWKNTLARERSALVRRLFKLQMQNADHLAELIAREMGKPVKEARVEINYGASFFEWFAEEAKRLKGEIFPSPFPNAVTMYTREPLGPVGIITPA